LGIRVFSSSTSTLLLAGPKLLGGGAEELDELLKEELKDVLLDVVEAEDELEEANESLLDEVVEENDVVLLPDIVVDDVTEFRVAK
jgi:hypothetical protein